MKKIFAMLLSLMLCLLLCISLAACKEKNPDTSNPDDTTKHAAKTEWESDAAKHWHECATEGHTDKLDEADHSWDAGEMTTAPTETTDGVKTFTCTVCRRTKNEPTGKLTHEHTFATEWSKDATNHWHAATCAHTDEKSDLEAHIFGAWTTKPGTGVHVDRVEQRTCSVCQFVEERTIPDTAFHDFDYENIKSDAANHWFECSCGEKAEIEAHTYGDWNEKTSAGEDQDKQYSRKCTECQYEDVLTFDNTRTNGTYCVAITGVFVIKGVKYVKAQVLRGTVTVGDNIAIDGLAGTFTIDGISRTDTNIQLQSASYGQTVNISIGTEDGDIDQITNPNVCGRLAYEPDTANVHTTFTAQINIDQSHFSGILNAGRTVTLDLYNVGYGTMYYDLVLPEGVTVAKDGESYVVTVTLPKNESRALWAGMEFTYKIYDSASSSYIIVATGIILSVAD